jgi:hypothetical protein
MRLGESEHAGNLSRFDPDAWNVAVERMLLVPGRREVSGDPGFCSLTDSERRVVLLSDPTRCH